MPVRVRPRAQNIQKVRVYSKTFPRNTSPFYVCSPPFRALKTRRVPQESVLRTECPFRTGKACFLHQMPLKMCRVPQEAFLNTECSFRTVEACFWYGALPKTHRTWLSGAQESGWQLPLRSLSTPRRSRGRVRRSCRLIFLLYLRKTNRKTNRKYAKDNNFRRGHAQTFHSGIPEIRAGRTV